MTPSDDVSSAVRLPPNTVAQRAVVRQTPADAAPYGRAHAVPVGDFVARSNWVAEALYRVFEIIVALIGLVVALPIILVEAALIRWDSPGPALFPQKRVARSAMVRGRDLEDRNDLKPPPNGYKADAFYFVPAYFRFVKFRTMYHDARRRFPELYAYKFDPSEFHKRHFKYDRDPRITPVGRVLRKLTVDELPNLWCVLIGDMRLVGPRPEIPEVVQYYTPEQMYKFACKPGITGLAQVNGRGLLSWGETLDWDLKYVRTRSVWGDLKIIFLTAKLVITRQGAF